MSLARTIGMGLLGAAALAVWLPALFGAGRGPALLERPRAGSDAGLPSGGDVRGTSAASASLRGPSGERAAALLALERLLPDRPQRSLADLAARPGASAGAADAWDELALRWARRVEREPVEDAR